MSDRYLILDETTGLIAFRQGINQSRGAPDKAKILVTDVTGRLDKSFMPVGVGPEARNITAGEGLSAGNYVYLNEKTGGGIEVLKADNSNKRPADGFVISAFASAASALVYSLEHPNTALSGLTIGDIYYLSTGGGVTSTAPTVASLVSTDLIVQVLGKAVLATEMEYFHGSAVILLEA